MADFKLVVSDPKTGKTVQKEVKDEQAGPLLGMKIGDTVKGDLIGFAGYEFLITGGSDDCGFPMRRDLPGSQRKKILSVGGVGVRPLRTKTLKTKPFQYYPGAKQRKMVCGNTVHQSISQINLKATKLGKDSLFEVPAPEGEAKPAEEKKAEVPKAEVPKAEVPKAEVKEEKPAEVKEEKKEEPKVEAKKEKPAEAPTQEAKE
jgi:small subunit ribosomal protein S6e